MKKIFLALILLASGLSQNYAQQNFYDVTPTDGNGIRFWSNNMYKIHMGYGSEYFFGPVQDYSIKMNMSGGFNSRGWTWGVHGQTPIAAINILGNMEIAGGFKANGSGQFNTYLDVGGLRNTNSAPGGLNIYDYTVGDYTNIQFAQSAWGGSNAILFNAYKSNPQVNGDLMAVGNVKHANDVGPYSAGSGMIHFLGNGGRMDFFLSQNSTGKNTSVNWQTPILTLVRGGNVGIGTTNPDGLLHIGSSNLGVGMAKRLLLEPPYHTGAAWEFIVRDNTASSYLGIGYGAESFTIHHEGNVGIGTIAPDAKLAVNGTIHAKEVKVDLTGWPDYVFNDGYKLLTLEEIKTYIDKNKHLPEVPSAKEMEANGVNLGEMNMLLLKKIEELTLHLIEQNELINKLIMESENQQSEIEKLKTLVNR